MNFLRNKKTFLKQSSGSVAVIQTNPIFVKDTATTTKSARCVFIKDNDTVLKRVFPTLEVWNVGGENGWAGTGMDQGIFSVLSCRFVDDTSTTRGLPAGWKGTICFGYGGISTANNNGTISTSAPGQGTGVAQFLHWNGSNAGLDGRFNECGLRAYIPTNEVDHADGLSPYSAAQTQASGGSRIVLDFSGTYSTGFPNYANASPNTNTLSLTRQTGKFNHDFPTSNHGCISVNDNGILIYPVADGVENYATYTGIRKYIIDGTQTFAINSLYIITHDEDNGGAVRYGASTGTYRLRMIVEHGAQS